MKIRVIDTTIDGELIGGAHTFLPRLLSGLQGLGHDVELITAGPPNKRVLPSLEAAAIRIWTDHSFKTRIVNDSAPGFAERLNSSKPDVFVISTSADIGWTILPLLDSRVATLTIGHNDAKTYYEPARHYARFLTGAIGVSEEICETYVESCGIDRSRVDWIPYGVTASETAPEKAGQGPLKLIYVGRLDEEQKRVSDLISTARRLTESGVDYRLAIVGDGDQMPVVKERLSAEIASKRIALYGWVDGNEVISRLRESDVFLLTSNYEGFCISLIEAMANGCCPVVTDIRSGNKQLVRDGENGFVVPVGDVDAFVDKIKYFAENRDKLLEFRQRAWETGRQYSLERMVESYERCFERAIEDARTNPRTPDPDFPLMESCRSKYPLWLRRLKARVRSMV